MWRQLLTAAFYYMPFLITIGFSLLMIVIGILCVLSGTFIVLAFAVYGVYAVLRDYGFLQLFKEKTQHLWKYIDQPFLDHLKQSFLLENISNIPTGPALYLCHPHGLTGFSWFFHFTFGLSEWKEATPRPLLAMHSIFFRIPFASDILREFCCIEATEEEIHKALLEDHSVAILLGGVEEMTHSGQDHVKLIVKKRKGYARLAKKANVPLVPMYTHDDMLFKEETFWVWKKINILLHKVFGVQIPLPNWQSMKTFASILNAPLKQPIQTFVLKPIETQNKDETQIRKDYVQSLKQFLKENKINASIVG